jgi:tripartite ATP-independent transporter DctM subunit
MFFAALFVLIIGYPVAFSFGAVSIIFGAVAAWQEVMPDGGVIADFYDEFLSMFSMMPFRIYSIMTNKILMAVPLFIFMGIVLQKSDLAKKMLTSIGTMFGRVRGGLAVSTMLIGALLAASTGVVGASVVAMGVISLPVMLDNGYKKSLSSGVVCAAGTLGQIIPPSIVLIVLADVFNLPVGDLFKKALFPGIVLVVAYIIYILVVAFFDKEAAPAMKMVDEKVSIADLFLSIVPPLLLIILVLGSIFAGVATPTESASLGALGSIILALIYKKFSFSLLYEASSQTVKTTAMIFAILVGATAFSMVFTYSGADEIVESFMTSLPGDKWGFIALSMLIIMFLGFFIDFIEISYIVVPILIPIAQTIGIDPLWFAILIALNLQTSFLTPPFGFSLFYLKGVAPKSVMTTDIYKGVIPFILIQVVVLLSIVLFPKFYGFGG